MQLDSTFPCLCLFSKQKFCAWFCAVGDSHPHPDTPPVLSNCCIDGRSLGNAGLLLCRYELLMLTKLKFQRVKISVSESCIFGADKKRTNVTFSMHVCLCVYYCLCSQGLIWSAWMPPLPKFPNRLMPQKSRENLGKPEMRTTSCKTHQVIWGPSQS